MSLLFGRQNFIKIAKMSNTCDSTTPKRTVKMVSGSTKNVLNTVNPEIFATSPRPGGYIKIMVPTKSRDQMLRGGPSKLFRDYEESDAESCASKALYTKQSHVSNVSSISHKTSKLVAEPASEPFLANYSKEFRLTRTIEETDWDITAMDETEAMVGVSNQLQEGENMLAVTISCVMMMAAKTPNIPDEYHIWAHNYLSCIKDEWGYHPPNIEGILNKIKHANTPTPPDEDGGKCVSSCKGMQQNQPEPE